MTNDNKHLDKLIEQGKRLQEQSQKGLSAADHAKAGGTVVGDFVTGIDEVQQAAKTVNSTRKIATEGALAAWKSFIKPAYELGKKILGPIYNGYKYAWQKTDKKAYDGKIKKACALLGRGLLIGLTICMGAQVMPAMVGGDIAREVVDVTVREPLWDAFRYATTHHAKETVYLNRVFVKDGVQYAAGCKTADCSGDNPSVTYEVKTSAFNRAWNVANRGSFLFKYDDVLNKIVTGNVNKCEVNTYGWRRMWSEGMQTYPVMLDVNCAPLSAKFDAAVSGQTNVSPTITISAPAAPVAAHGR